MLEKKIYFKNLDSLRAIAALVVLVQHIELLKKRSSVSNLFNNGYSLLPEGHIGVILFFAISGFLITYLLVKEQEKNGQIAFRKFYLRRILRIWPLYYLIIVLSFLLLDGDYKMSTVALSLTIFPNIAETLSIGWPTSHQIWSIGVEEQFYLFWPFLMTLIPNKKILLFLFLFFIGYSILPHLIGFINVRTFRNTEFTNFTNRFFYFTKFNCMAVGGFFGFMYAKKHNWLHFFHKDYIAYPSIILSFALWFSGFRVFYFTDEIYSILFAIMILNFTTNDKLKINIDSKVFNFLGRISYGIYMYHWIIILLCFKYISFSTENLHLNNLILYLVVLASTIFVSWISYISFEKYFLNLKNRYGY